MPTPRRVRRPLFRGQVPSLMAKSPERSESPSGERRRPLLDPLRAVCLLLILLALCVSFARLLSVEPMQSANDRSRWCTVWSLVERGTYRIDEAIRKPGWDTIDKVLHDGHFYSSKPPLFSRLTAYLYAGVKETLGWTLDDELAATVRLILVLVNFLPWGAALWRLSELVRRYAASPVTVVFLTATAAWGTLLTPFLVTLNNHLPAAVCLVFALEAALRITLDGQTEWWRFVVAGFFAALLTTLELPAAACGLALFGLLVWKERQRTLSYFLPAALFPLAAFFITNGQATGGLLPFYSYFGTEKYLYVYQGQPSYWLNPKGIDRGIDSPLTYLLHCTLGHHGLLSLSPVLWLAVLGWAVGLRREARLRDVLALGLGLTLLVLGYYLTRTANYNYGGRTVALRWMLWLVPLWLIAMIPVLDRWADRRWFRGVAVALLLPSVFSAWYPLGTPWQDPWLFTVMTRWGWIDYSDPPPKFPRPVYSWLYELPTGPHQPSYWIELGSIDAEGVRSRLRVEDGGRVLVNQRDARIVRLTMSGPQSWQLALTIDAEAFRAGEPLSRVLLWPQGVPSGESWRRIASVLTGLPSADPASSPAFQPHSQIHGGAPVRAEMFEGLLATARVLYPPGPTPETRLYESRIVVSPEVPFGILRLETYVYDAAGRTLHAQRRWIIERAGQFLPRPDAPAAAQPDRRE